MAELWSLLEGLKLARSLKFSKVEIRFDSLEVVETFGGRKLIVMGDPLLMRF